MKLRIAQLIVQPVLVWDNGEELTPGPELNQIAIPLSKLSELSESLPAEILALQEQLTKAESNDEFEAEAN